MHNKEVKDGLEMELSCRILVNVLVQLQGYRDYSENVNTNSIYNPFQEMYFFTASIKAMQQNSFMYLCSEEPSSTKKRSDFCPHHLSNNL